MQDAGPPVSGDQGSQDASREAASSVGTGSTPVHMQGNGQLRIGGPLLWPHSKPRLSALLAPGECSTWVRPRRWQAIRGQANEEIGMQTRHPSALQPMGGASRHYEAAGASTKFRGLRLVSRTKLSAISQVSHHN